MERRDSPEDIAETVAPFRRERSKRRNPIENVKKIVKKNCAVIVTFLRKMMYFCGLIFLYFKKYFQIINLSD